MISILCSILPPLIVGVVVILVIVITIKILKAPKADEEPSTPVNNPPKNDDLRWYWDNKND